MCQLITNKTGQMTSKIKEVVTSGKDWSIAINKKRLRNSPDFLEVKRTKQTRIQDYWLNTKATDRNAENYVNKFNVLSNYTESSSDEIVHYATSAGSR